MKNSRSLCHPLFALPILLGLSAVSARADDDRLNRHPTQQTWVHNTTTTVIANYVSNGYRITDLEINSVSPFRVTAAMVKNTGAYAKRWYYYYGQTVASISDKINTLGLRITDLEPYNDGGALRFAAVFEDNRGSNARAWWWYVGVQFADLQTAWQANNARIIDLNKYTIGSTTAYAAVMIRNTGSDAQTWSWALNYSAANVIDRMQTIGHRIYDIEKVATDRYNVISIRENPGISYWFNVTPSYAESLRSAGNYRMIDLEPQADGRLTIVMVRNSGIFETEGSSCGSGFSHTGSGNPAPGQSPQFRLNAPSSFVGFVTMMFGAQATSFDLAAIGAAGCRLYVQPQITFPVLATGSTNLQMQLPNVTAMVGQSLFTQFAVPQPGLNSLGLLTTNRLKTTIGPVN